MVAWSAKGVERMCVLYRRSGLRVHDRTNRSLIDEIVHEIVCTKWLEVLGECAVSLLYQ